MQQLAQGITPKSFEPLPYILNEDDEITAIKSAISQRCNTLAWRRREFIPPAGTIEQQLQALGLSREGILHSANNRKHADIFDRELIEKRRDHERQKKEAIVAEWTAERMYKHLVHVAASKDVHIKTDDPSKLHAIKALCFFLSKDKRFETDLEHSFARGLLFHGEPGVGKSFAIECLASNPLDPIHIIHMGKIDDAIKTYGDVKLNLNGQLICLDEVGSRDPVTSYYGNKQNWFKNFIEDTYQRPELFPRIIITSNLDADDFETQHGKHIRSRLAQMFNVIHIGGSDFRRI